MKKYVSDPIYFVSLCKENHKSDRLQKWRKIYQKSLEENSQETIFLMFWVSRNHRIARKTFIFSYVCTCNAKFQRTWRKWRRKSEILGNYFPHHLLLLLFSLFALNFFSVLSFFLLNNKKINEIFSLGANYQIKIVYYLDYFIFLSFFCVPLKIISSWNCVYIFIFSLYFLYKFFFIYFKNEKKERKEKMEKSSPCSFYSKSASTKNNENDDEFFFFMLCPLNQSINGKVLCSHNNLIKVLELILNWNYKFTGCFCCWCCVYRSSLLKDFLSFFTTTTIWRQLFMFGKSTRKMKNEIWKTILIKVIDYDRNV